MADKSSASGVSSAAKTRDDRRKAALKANMARRKAQMKARAAEDTGKGDVNGDTNAGQQTPDTDK